LITQPNPLIETYYYCWFLCVTLWGYIDVTDISVKIPDKHALSEKCTNIVTSRIHGLRYLSLVVLQGNFNGWKSGHTIWWLYASFAIKGVVIWRGSTVYSVVYLFCKNGFPRAILHWRWSHGCEMWQY
jgi:hypothetical protein